MSSPVYLYQFKQEAKSWLFTSSSLPETYQSVVYMPRLIKHGNIEQSEEFARNTLNVEFSRTDEFAAMFLGLAGLPVSLTLFKKVSSNVTLEWKGRVSGAKISDTKIVLSCESLHSALKQPGLRSFYTINCRHGLYSPSCGINRRQYRHTDTVSNLIAPNQFTLTQSKPDGFYNGGIAEIEGQGLRTVITHVNNIITLNAGFASISNGAVIHLWPGCQHDINDCKTKFNNLPNYGGFPHFTKKNRFENK